MKSKDTLRTEAKERAQARALLTPKQQLKLIEGRRGTSERETKRLRAKLLAPAKVIQHPNHTRI